MTAGPRPWQLACTEQLSGAALFVAFRYLDWLLTVPLLLVELILVLERPPEQPVCMSWKLGCASTLLRLWATLASSRSSLLCAGSGGSWPVSILLRRPSARGGPVRGLGLQVSTTVASQMSSARYLMAISWCTYTVVFIVEIFGLSGPTATMFARLGTPWRTLRLGWPRRVVLGLCS